MNEALAHWRTLQAEIADSAAWSEAVVAAQADLGLVFHDTPMVRVAEPQILTESEMAEDQAAASAVTKALVAAGRQVLADQALQDRYTPGWLEGVPDADLFMIPPGYPDPIVFGRLDGVRTAEGLRFLEFNGGLPGGILPADASARLMAGTDLAQRFAEQFPFRTPTVGDDVLTAMVRTWHEYGGAGDPYTVVAMPEELAAIATPAVTYLKGLGEQRGLEIDVADPGELVFADGRLRRDGRPVDVLVRAFFTPMFAYLGERLDGIKAALRAESICMITSLQSGMFGLKSLFAMVTDPTVALDLSEADAVRAREHLPWTRMVKPGDSTDAAGSRVDLLPYLAAEREQLVIKPVEGYGGAGVELGWTHTPQSWQEVIDRAAAGGHIAQWKVPILTEHYTVLGEGFPLQGFNGDHNPLLCGDRIVGYYVRLASEDSGITNVTGGGATIAPTFVIEG